MRLLGVAEVQAVGQRRAARRRRRRGWRRTRRRPRRPRRAGRPRRGGRCRRSRSRSRGSDPPAPVLASSTGSASTAASACSGRRTVRDCTTGSYCSNTGRREAMLALASSASSVSAGVGVGRRAAASPPRVQRRGRRARARGRTAGSRRRAAAPAARRRRSPSLEDPEALGVGDLADRASRAISHFSQTASTSSTSSRLDHAQHPLLGLGDHDLERLHVGLAQRHPGDVDVEPDLALAGHLRGRGGEPGGAEVLQRGEQVAVEQLEAALHQLLLGERVADLDGRALGVVTVAELGAGEHRGAADAVAAGQRAEQDQHVADARRRPRWSAARAAPCRRPSR